MKKCKSKYKYTAYFCEENIWLLGKSLVEEKYPTEKMMVFFLTNPQKKIPLKNQICVPLGETVVWDYHVILGFCKNSTWWIFDFDSYLDFPSVSMHYINNTFYDSKLLLPQYCLWIRAIKLENYLKYFYSNRSHMLNEKKAPIRTFPNWSPILSNDNPRHLASYLNLGVKKQDEILNYEDFIKKYGQTS